MPKEKTETMPKKQDMLSPSQKKLERASVDLQIAAEERQSELDELYDKLAGLPETKEKTSVDAEVREEIDSLKRTNANLRRTFAKTAVMEDELENRYRDICKSLNKKWYRLNPPANGTIDLEEKRQNHFARGVNLYKLLLLCFVGSFVGVVLETLWCVITNGYVESRAGMVIGPFNLLYGVGAAAISASLYKYRNHGKIMSFFSGMIVGSVVEYVCSWGQEIFVGSRSWDYSNMPFNVNGRICLLYSIFWGILGVLWIKDIYPRVAKWILKIPNSFGKILTWALTVFLLLDGILTFAAVDRWSQRVYHTEKSGAVWEFLDEHFDDRRMEIIFANMEFGWDKNVTKNQKQ